MIISSERHCKASSDHHNRRPMRERPTLERKNIPIAALLKSPPVQDAVHSICRTQCVDDRFLAGAAVTFRQLSLLSSDTRIPGETLKLIFEFLAEEDRKHPVFLEERYPYLKQSSWSLNMSEISYMKVSAERQGEYLFSIRAIQKEIDPVSEQPYLMLFPEYSGERSGCSNGEGERKEESIKVSFDDEYHMQEFMKNIILNGRAELFRRPALQK